MRRLPILSLILFPTLSHAADFDGASLNLFWGAPFALILFHFVKGFQNDTGKQYSRCNLVADEKYRMDDSR